MPNLTDPIGDLITRMRNAQKARKPSCRGQWSTINEELCNVLKSEGWIAEVRVLGEAPHQEIEVTFNPEKPTLQLKRVSKPGRRVYAGSKELSPVLRGYGAAIITTSQGLLTDAQARQKKVGGEILCTVS
jgi:small subunit ribosomal protein S8